MMKSSVIFVLIGSAALNFGAIAAADNLPTATKSQPGRTADKDFHRLSVDGASAFDDIRIARMAIFDGRTEEAAKLVADAKASLEKAKTDDTVFMKAESAFQAPSQPRSGQAEHHNNATSIAWLPVDGEITVGESYTPTPEKAAAIVTAKKNLQKGDSEKAFETVRLAAIDVDFTLAAVPMDETLTDVAQANTLITNHDYYGASQALKKAEDGVRYDEIDDIANVKGKSNQAAAEGK